jgi:hypothetical protein
VERQRTDFKTYVLLLLVDVADLEPDVLLSERARWVIHNVLEALQSEKS